MSTTSKIARWWVMGRKGMSDPLITVVKMNGVLQASTGRGPQSRRSLNLERVEKWLQRAFFVSLLHEMHTEKNTIHSPPSPPLNRKSCVPLRSPSPSTPLAALLSNLSSSTT